MTKLGTAYVAVEPDLSAFDRIMVRSLGSSLAKAGERSGRDFSKGFEKNTSGVLLPVSRALRDVGEDATSAGKRTKQFGTDTAKAATVAREAVKKIGKEITDLPALDIPAPKVGTPNLPALDLSRTGRIDLQIAGASADVRRLRSELEALTARPRSVEVDADIGRLVAKLDQAEAKVAQLESKRVEIKADVDKSLPGTLNSVTSSATSLMASLGAGGGGGLTGATARVSAGFISFGAAAGPLALVLAGLAVTVGVALVGALAALASSLALAAAGAAALGAALGGVLGVSLGLLIPVGIRLGKVFESMKADSAAADAVARNSASGSAAAAAAATAQASASRALGEAQRQMGIASKAAFREMADAAEAASDAIRGVQNAQLNLDQAKLSTEQAKLELERFRAELGETGAAFGSVFEKFTDVSVDTSGLRKAIEDANNASGTGLELDQQLELRQKILDVRAARLREKDAIDGVSDAQRTATRAQERHNEFVRQGRLASEGYRGALRGVEAATLAVAAASAQQGAGVAAQEKAAQLAGKLTKAEVKLKDTLVGVGKALRGAFTPASDAVITGITNAVGRAPKLVNPLRGSIKRLGESWRDAIDEFSKDLIRPDSISKIRAFTNAGARLAGPVTRGISSLLDVLTDIGRAALPHLVSGTKKVADRMASWAKTTGNTKKLDKTIGNIVDHLKTWLGVAGALGGTFVAFIKAAAGPGQGLAESIKDLADRTTRWLNSKQGRQELKQFFIDAIDFSKRLVEFFGRLIKRAGEVAAVAVRIGAKFHDARGVADGLVLALGALFTLKLAKGLINGVSDLRRGLAGAHRAATILHSQFFTLNGAEAGGGLVGKAKGALKSIGEGLAAAGREVARAGRAVARRLVAIFATQGALAGAAAGNAAAGAEGLAAPARFDKMRDVGRRLGRVFGRGILFGLLAFLPSLVSEFQQKITDALGLGEGAKKASEFFGTGGALGKIKELFGFAAGGIVPGTGTGDTVPAWLTPREFVTRAPIVARYTPAVFADINAGRLDPRVGYEAGQRPSVGPIRASGPKFASGGFVGAREQATPQRIAPTFPITVAGGGPPDPLDLAVKTSRAIEARYGGDPGQD